MSGTSIAPAEPVEFSTISFRLLRGDDEGALRTLFHNLSPRSRYSRFHGQVSELSDATWRYLCEVDGVDHVAIGAFATARHGEKLRLVGVARFIRLPAQPRRAELAITVLDELQRRGLGTNLLDLLLRLAVHRGIDELIAPVLGDNLAMKRLLQHFGSVAPTPEGYLLPARRLPTGFGGVGTMAESTRRSRRAQATSSGDDSTRWRRTG